MDTELKDHYQLLGVERDATTDEIKEAYRELARIFHPDSNFYADLLGDTMPGPEQDLFKKITDAYNTLINEQARAEYDQSLGSQFKGWEAEEHDPNEWESAEQYLRWKQKEDQATQRVFGSCERELDDEYEYEDNDYHQPAMSVSQMIKIQREPTGPNRSFFITIFLVVSITALITALLLV